METRPIDSREEVVDAVEPRLRIVEKSLMQGPVVQADVVATFSSIIPPNRCKIIEFVVIDSIDDNDRERRLVEHVTCAHRRVKHRKIVDSARSNIAQWRSNRPENSVNQGFSRGF